MESCALWVCSLFPPILCGPALGQVARQPTVPATREGTPIKLKPEKGSKQRGQERCKARTKAGSSCQAPAIEGGLCFCHAHPERLAELGRKGGQKNRHWSPSDHELPQKPLKSTSEVAMLLEETINRIRQGPFDLRAANSIGFLAGILLKALERSRIEERLANLEVITTGKSEGIEAFDFRPRKDSQSEQPTTTPEDN